MHFFLYFRLHTRINADVGRAYVILYCSTSLEERGQPGGADLPQRQRGTNPSGPETEAEKDGRKAPPVLEGIRAGHLNCIPAP